MSECNKKQIRTKARKIVDLEEDIDDLMDKKEDRGLSSSDEDELQSKKRKVDVLTREIASCGVNVEKAIDDAENELDEED